MPNLPNDKQKQLMCKMLYRALCEIRLRGWEGKAEQAADLADAFHGLPIVMYSPDFSWSMCRHFLECYQSKYPRSRNSGFDYLFFLEQIESGANDFEIVGQPDEEG